MKKFIIIKDFRFLMDNFGFIPAFQIRILPVIKARMTGVSYSHYYNAALTKYLKNILAPILSYYKENENKFDNEEISEHQHIWVCWWQGEEMMPDVIKKCYNNLNKNSNGRVINLITKNNYTNYITLPEHIKNRVLNNEITITHLSDIIRMNLLKDYGGLWLDAAIWVTKPLIIPRSSLYSLKQNLHSESLISDYKWIGGCMGGGKNNILFYFVYDSFCYYWNVNNKQINYLLIDYIVNIGYENIGSIRRMIDDIPYESPKIHIMKKLMNEELDYANILSIIEENPFLSLSWKNSYLLKTTNNKSTYFSYFMNV